MQRSEARYKHELVNRNGTPIGDVCTFKVDIEAKIGNKLFLDSLIDEKDVPPIDEHNALYFGAHKRTAEGSPLLQLLATLRHNHQAAVFYLDSKGTKGFFIPVNADQRAIINKIYPDAFRCFILTDQAAAAIHYNKTVRIKGERYLSQIFHLRNLNNWIKAVLIGESNTIISNGWSSWAFQKSQVLEGLYLPNDTNYPLRRRDLASSAISNKPEDRLIAHAVSVRSKKAIDVLDFGCGKGGDIGKWLKCDRGIARYVGVDIAKKSLEDFADRVRDDPKVDKIDRLICADMGQDDLDESSLNTYVIREAKWGLLSGCLNKDTAGDTFDVASCQFAMHYMFQTPERASHFFSNLSRHLRVGGSFVATTMDSRVVADAAHRKAFGPLKSVTDGSLPPLDRDGAANTEPVLNADRSIAVTTEAGTKVMSLEFDAENWNRLLNYGARNDRDTSGVNDSGSGSGSSSSSSSSRDPEEEHRKSFGIRYDFQLDDGTSGADGEGSSAVKAPEWLVPLGKPLEDLARKHDLELIYCQNFQGFVQSHLRKENTYSSQYRDLLYDMDVMDIGQSMSFYEWEIAR
jgi:SAM-dependent methyltransferase